MRHRPVESNQPMEQEPMSATKEEPIVATLHAEELSVTKRRIVTGRAQISTVTREHEELVEELLRHEHVEIERVPIGKPLDQAPKVREEGDVLIIPVVEEVLVTERRLFLKEEVRIRRVRGAEKHRQRVRVRKQEAVITRQPATPNGC